MPQGNHENCVLKADRMDGISDNHLDDSYRDENCLTLNLSKSSRCEICQSHRVVALILSCISLKSFKCQQVFDFDC